MRFGWNSVVFVFAFALVFLVSASAFAFASPPISCNTVYSFGTPSSANPYRTNTAKVGDCFANQHNVVKIADISEDRQTADIVIYDRFSWAGQKTLYENPSFTARQPPQNKTISKNGFTVTLEDASGRNWWTGMFDLRAAKVSITWPSANAFTPNSFCERTVTMSSTQTQREFADIKPGECVAFGKFLIKKNGELYSTRTTSIEGIFLTLFEKNSNGVFEYKTPLFYSKTPAFGVQVSPTNGKLQYQGLTVEHVRIPYTGRTQNVVFKLKVSYAPPAPPTPLANSQFLACVLDYNADGVANVADISEIARHYNKKATETCGSLPCAIYDANQDGTIDQKEVDLLHAAFNKKCDFAKLDLDDDGEVEGKKIYQAGDDSHLVNMYLNPSGATQYTSSKTCGSDANCLNYDFNADGLVNLFGTYRDVQILQKYDGACARFKTEDAFAPTMRVGNIATLNNSFKVSLGDITGIATGTQMQYRALFRLYDSAGYFKEQFTLGPCETYNKPEYGVKVRAVNIRGGQLGGNNYASVSFSSTPPSRQTSPVRADLTVTSAAWRTSRIETNKAALLSVTIKNNGNAEARGFYTILDAEDWSGMGCTAATTTQDYSTSVAAGASKTVTFGVKCSKTGTKTFTVKTDYTNSVSESNEKNNQRQVTLNVIASSAPAFAITEAHYTPPSGTTQGRTFATTNKAAVCWMGFTPGAKTYRMSCLTTACTQNVKTLTVTKPTIYVRCSASDGSGSTTKTITTVSAQVQGCVDPDVAQTMSRTRTTAYNATTRGTDTCVGGILREYMCSGNNVVYVPITCSQGYYCAYGACTPIGTSGSGTGTGGVIARSGETIVDSFVNWLERTFGSGG